MTEFTDVSITKIANNDTLSAKEAMNGFDIQGTGDYIGKLTVGEDISIAVTYSDGKHEYTVDLTATVTHVGQGKHAGTFKWTAHEPNFQNTGIQRGADVVQVTFPGNVHSHNLSFTDQAPPCFLAGTLIRTPGGDVAVETLARGDLVTTADGRAEPVSWIGRRTVVTLFADPIEALPVRIRAGALAEQVPARDLLVSPDHALLVDGVLVQAGALVNGVSIVRETDLPERFTYYHLELADHSLILAEGAPAETFVDNVQRQAFDNWDEYEALYPEGRAVAEMAYPRAKSYRQTPARLRERLMARAAVLFGAAEASAA